MLLISHWFPSVQEEQSTYTEGSSGVVVSLFTEELLSEDKKEIIDKNPQNHGRFHGIELLH